MYRTLIETNSKLIGPEQDLGVVHFVTPGENQLYAGSAGTPARLTPTLCIHSFPLPFAVWRPYFEQGVHAVTPSIRHVPPQGVDPKTKTARACTIGWPTSIAGGRSRRHLAAARFGRQPHRVLGSQLRGGGERYDLYAY